MASTKESYHYFFETYLALTEDPRKFTYRFRTGSWSQHEKKLLHAAHLYKKNQKKELFDILKSFKSPDAFYEGVRLYLLGRTHNHYGAFEFSLEHLYASVKKFHEAESDLFLIHVYSAIILAYANKRQLSQADPVARELEKLTASYESLHLMKEHALLVYASHKSHFESGIDKLESILSQKTELVDFYRPSLLVLKFYYHFFYGEFKECEEVLENYRVSAGFLAKVNYPYMKSLFEFIVKKRPLYLYSKDYADFPEMAQQVEVLKALIAGDHKDAEKIWEKLAHHHPDLYTSGFTYAGEKNLFSEALVLARSDESLELDRGHFQSLKTDGDKLAYIFEQVHRSLKKSELIHLLWQEELSEQTEGRLRKLIYNYRKKTGLEVASQQGTYKVVKKA